MITSSFSRSRPSRLAASILASALVTSCGGDSGLPENADDFVANYAAIVSATYADSVTQAAALGASVDTLVATPTDANLDAARDAWVLARQTYLQSEAFRFYGGPIDDVDDFLNAWPLNEAHIDYVAGNATAGYVNDLAFVITPEGLEAQNLPAGGGEADVAVGWHAIEFLLWGQDTDPAGPGDRPVSDYDSSGGPGMNVTRRALALTTLSDLLDGHLADLAAQWVGGGAYRTEMTTGVSSTEAVRRIVYGLSIFSGNELGGERLVAMTTHSQEDEHSCFSDTTDQDFVFDAIGIENVYLGRYVRVDGSIVSGVGLYDVVRKVDADLADRLRDQIHTSVQLALSIQAPFDQELLAGNLAGTARLQALAASLSAQQALFNEVAAVLDLPNEPVN